jgi:hypothetical protein
MEFWVLIPISGVKLVRQTSTSQTNTSINNKNHHNATTNTINHDLEVSARFECDDTDSLNSRDG